MKLSTANKITLDNGLNVVNNVDDTSACRRFRLVTLIQTVRAKGTQFWNVWEAVVVGFFVKQFYEQAVCIDLLASFVRMVQYEKRNMDVDSLYWLNKQHNRLNLQKIPNACGQSSVIEAININQSDAYNPQYSEKSKTTREGEAAIVICKKSSANRNSIDVGTLVVRL